MTTRPVPLIDKPNAGPSDLDNLTKRLAADGGSPSAKPAADDKIPAKFRGKSLEEVVESYTNLEQRFGQLGNDHGQLRNRVDQLLELKRAEDLRSGTAPEQRKAVEVTSTQIIDNPSKILTGVRDEIAADVAEQVNTRVSELETRLASDRFSLKHQDYAEINNSAEFLNWVNSSPTRMRVAAQARENRDFDAADDLLTEYKQGKQHAKQDDKTDGPGQRQDNLSRARAASLESPSASGASSQSGERFSRAALIDLKINQPKKYAALGDKITRAYIEGRVDD